MNETARPHGAALLLLADGRFPAGGYAHSGGLEPAITAGLVSDLHDLAGFLAGRASTVGFVSAAFAAAASGAVLTEDLARLDGLDAELDARMPSPAQRSTSRQLGRQYLRVMATIAPHPAYASLGARPHQPLVHGVACAAMGLAPADAALSSLHESVAGPAAAAVRLLSLDPFGTHQILADLTSTLNDLAARAIHAARGSVEELPSCAAPLLDICAEHHACHDARLFAS